jgi:hypothetical protein
VKLTKKHIELCNKIKERGLSDGCSDLSWNEISILSQSEWDELSKAYHEWNGDPEEYQEGRYMPLPDFAILGFVWHLLTKDIA